MLGLGAVSTCSGMQSVFAARAEKKRTPNVIYFMSDELGYFELSHMGHPHIKTPHIDRMAEEGIRFTQALAGLSLCAPTRCCLMTGKHSGHTSVRTNPGSTPMRADEATVASVLKQAGYATGGFGKWGCGGRGSTGVPEKHGFDVFFGYYDQVHAHSYYTPYLIQNSIEVPLPGNKGLSDGDIYSHYVIMEQARKFIRKHKDEPFFCYLPVTPPHGIFDIPEEDPAWKLYKDKPWPNDAKKYAAMVTMVDRNVGELTAMLKEFGIEENTIFFFCGDNGGHDYFSDKDHPRGFHGPNVNPKTGEAFRGQKGTLYEGGLRIPMIVRWPGHIRPGRVSGHLCYFPDIMPTIAELAGVSGPEDSDGISIVPELLGEEAAGRAQEHHDYLYWELYGKVAVRMDNWKACKNGKDAPWELYNLNKDLEEKLNVADANSHILKTMKAHAEKAHEEAREGTFHNRALTMKDKAAKFGEKGRRQRRGTVYELPEKGLLPREHYKLVRASSESAFNDKRAVYAFDGDSHSIWHTQWKKTLAKPPHELVIDLGAICTVRGIRYLARQDNGWNGTFKTCEVYLSTDAKKFPGTPHCAAEFQKTKKPQEVTCTPARAQYVLLRILSEINGKEWASAAEIGVIGEQAG